MSDAASGKVRRLRRMSGPAAAGEGRFRANWPAELRLDERRVRCKVLDISVADASIELDAPLGSETSTRLIIGANPPIRAEIAWRRAGRAGLRFLEAQHWISERHAARFDPAAWLRGR
jgi:hypothetical protein